MYPDHDRPYGLIPRMTDPPQRTHPEWQKRSRRSDIGSSLHWRTLLARKGSIVIDRERCKGCHICFDFCPLGLISVAPGMNRKGYQPAWFDETPPNGNKTCTGCAMCATVCPEIAIEVYRER
jgi:2-oxoglutarate ferredoxin oxidoreductase subunit delta